MPPRGTARAAVLVRLHAGRVSSDKHHATGLYELVHDANYAGAAALAIPPLLEQYPVRTGAWGLHELNTNLLPGLRFVDRSVAADLLRRRMALPRLGRQQRICLLVASTQFCGPEAVSQLFATVKMNRRCIATLADAMRAQGILAAGGQPLGAPALKEIAFLLARITPHQADWEGGIVGREEERAQLLRGVLDLLSNDPSAAARQALEELQRIPEMASWRGPLAYQAQHQRAVQREAFYSAPTIEQATAVLANRQPATGNR